MTKKVFKAYGLDLPLIPVPPMPITSASAPTTSDKNYIQGQSWIRKITADTFASYTFGGIDSSGDAIWLLASPGASDVDTLTGDSGGAISPAAGNITLAGGTNITSAGAGSTITFNLDAAITLATSVTSPIYTSAAGMAITAAGSNDITVKMGDAAGSNKVSFTDSADAEVASLDSDGTLTVVNMDGIIGATTPAAITGTTITGNTSVTSGGNIVMSAVATQLEMNGGAVTDFIGQATLVSGTVTIANTNIAATDRIFLTRADANSSTALGLLTITAQTASTSFVITALDPADGSTTITGDVSIVNYFIVRQN